MNVNLIMNIIFTIGIVFGGIIGLFTFIMLLCIIWR
jgi:hypothetical protein